MKKINYSVLGIILYFIITLIDKYIISLPIYLYIPLGIISIILIIKGLLKDKLKQPKSKKIKNIILAFLITLLIIIIYINPILLYNNYKLINNIKDNLNKEQIATKDLIPFDYDKAYIYMPYTYKEQIEKEIGIKSRYIKDNTINDNTQEIIIVKNNKVISSTFISIPNDNFTIQTLAEDSYLTSKDDTLFIINKSNNNYYLIEHYKEKEEIYKNITFKIPGTWWEEDNEDPYRLYYLDIEENINNLKLSTLENFNFKKYKKQLTILEEKEETINNLNTYYLKVEIDNNYIEHHYIVKTTKETYLFNLYSNKKVSQKLKNELHKVIESININ